MTALSFGSLFAGIGGLDLGFERAGFQCLWQVELDPYARAVLAKHWPHVRRHDDVKTWPLADTAYVDCLIGGFPCQDISNAGRKGGINGNQSSLFFEFLRVARELGCRYLVLENVSALLIRGMGDVLGALASFGFNAEWHCFGAADIGAPHQRDRLFLIAYSTANPSTAQRDWSGTIDRMQHQLAEVAAHNCGQSQAMADTSRAYVEGQRKESQRTLAQLSDIGDAGWWSTEPALDRVAHGVPNRVDRLRCLGNAVVPQAAQFVAELLLDRIQRGF